MTFPYRYSAVYAVSADLPVITTQPVDATVASGATATFTVVATGTSTLSYQWYTGTSGSTGSPISGATSASYTTAALSASGTYWVRVTSTGGTADSRTASATVVAPAPPVGPGGGDLLVEWWAIPASGSPYLLFDVLDWTVSIEGGSRGTVSVTYPAAGPLYATLVAATIGADRDLEVEIRVSAVGTSTVALRALLTDSEVDEVSEVKARTFRGPLIGQLLNEVVLHNNGAAADGSTSFSNMSPGAIVSSLVADGQARGALAGITVASFSSSVDSTGLAWPTLQTITLSPGGTYLSILRELEDAGVLEWELVPTSSTSRSLRLYAPGRMGVDRTIVSPPLVLRSGRDITAAPRKHSVSNAVTALLVSGSGGNYTSVSDSSALARRGRRIEGYVSAAGIASTTGLGIFGTSQLAQKSVGSQELEHTLVLADPTSPKPLIDYGLRDLVYSDTLGVGEAVRVQQIVLQREGAEVSARVVVGNLIAERLAAIARKLERLANGTAVIGSSEPAGPLTNDLLAPNAPTGLALGTGVVPDGIGGSLSAVFATWAAPLTNTDGSVCNDIAGYELHWRYVQAGYPSTYNEAAAGTGLQTDFPVGAVGVVVGVAVRAYDRAGNRSAYSTEVQITTGRDVTPPPVPAAPTLVPIASVIDCRWTGLGSAGEAMGADFDHADVHVSSTSGFSYSSATKRAELRGRGTVVLTGLSFGTTFYVVLVAYDRSGNPSAQSAQTAVVSTPLIGTELSDAIISAAKLGAQSVTTPKIFPEAVITPHLSIAAFQDTAIPNGDFEDVDLTTATKPALWSLLSSTGSTPTFSRDTTAANVMGGSAALKISLPAASGSARIGSSVIPVRPGELYYLEIPAFASRAVTGGLSVRAYIDYNNPPIPSNTGVDFLLGTISALPTLYPGANFGPPATSRFSVNFGIGNDVGGTGQDPAWMRIVIVAGLVSGDSSALDVWVDQIRLRKVVGTAEIQDASITNAKIVNATILAAKIGTVSVGSIVGGTATFSMLMATGDIRSANSGQRWILDPAGLRFYDSSGNNTLDANVSAGTVSIVGAFTTSVGTNRIQLTNTGGPTVNLFTSATTTPMYLRAVADSANSATTLLIHGPPNTSYSPNRSQKIRVGFNDIVMGWEDVGDTSGLTQRGAVMRIQPTSWVIETRNSSSTLLNGLRILADAANPGEFQYMNAGDPYGCLTLASSYAYLHAKDTFGVDQAQVIAYSSGRIQIIGSNLNFDTGNQFKIGPNIPIVGTSTLGYDSSARFGMDSAPTPLYLRWNSGSPQWVRHDTNAAVKTFVADHPLDPARHLVHATVESPAVTNLYTGAARLIRGRAVVELPGYFEAANRREGRVVVLTPMTADSDRVAVVAASYPRDGRFTIRAMGPDCDVSWLVTAVRADVPHLDPEPLRAGNRVRGDGPYTYLVQTGAP